MARIWGGRYLSHVAILLTGGATAQLISLGSAPFLTRLYEPAFFGELALFVAIVAAISPGVSGRYEAAVIVAPDERMRDSLVYVSGWFSFFVCALFLCALLVSGDSFVSFLSADSLGFWVWLTPLALFLTGAIGIFQSYANALKEYKQISGSMVIQAAVVALVSLIFGYFGNSAFGLLVANLLGLLLACGYLLWRYRKLLSGGGGLSRKTFMLAARYRDYPIFNATTNILNGIMSGLPVFFLAKYFGDAVVGYYALLLRVGVAPLGLISSAVSRVNVKKMAEVIQKGDNALPYLWRITALLGLLSTVPTICLTLTAPDLFSWAFGEEWHQAGRLLVILMPALAIQFVASTLSMSFVAAGRLRLQAVWQVLSLLITLVAFYEAAQCGDIVLFFWVFMIKDSILYILYYFMLVFALKRPVRIHG